MTMENKISLVVSTISALATVAAATMYLWTLKHVERQSSNTYRPHLFIDSIYFSVLGLERNKIIMPRYWARPEVQRNTIYQFGQELNTNEYNLKCYNIGFGTAKKVSVDFSYDFQKLLNSIALLERYVSEDRRLKIKSNSNFVTFQPSNDLMPFLSCGISYRNTLNSYHSYILPVNISNSYTSIPIPMLFIELLNVFVFYLSSLNDSESLNIDELLKTSIPQLICKITYSDIFNEPSSLELTISTVLNSWGERVSW